MPDSTENKPSQPVEAPKDAAPVVQETAEAKAERESREAEERKKAKEIGDKAHAEGDKEQAESSKKAEEELPKKLEEAGKEDEADKGNKEKPDEKDKKAADAAKEAFEAQKLAAEKALKEAKDSGKPEDEIKKLQDALTAIEEQGKKLGTKEEKVEAKKGAFDGIKEAFKNLGDILGKLLGFILGIEFKTSEEEEELYDVDGDLAKAEEVDKSGSGEAKENPGAKAALEKALAEHPEYKGFAEGAEKKFGIPKNIIYAIIYLESGFKSGIKNKDSNATGLGQFIPKTWESFKKANPEFKDKDPTDPEASFMATAWYAKLNADACKIDVVKDPQAAKKLYIAHHEGTAGYVKFQAGDVTPPKSYAAKGYDTSDKYKGLISRIGGGVQKNADTFKTVA